MTLDVPDYSSETGFRARWARNFKISVTLEAGAVCLRGNQAELRAPANHLLNLTKNPCPWEVTCI
ncbi:hypothetical protein GCM10011495_31260 [Hymenobacter frigidus]|jgi:hypothetical protein|uniref:Uncharacterized protein n=2 Tax=Hymenobacter frigidus TaxID=1524095 RepID=A0ABQ2A9Z5_9BACT|nr:hypothetical protein GCM10011495_31260 [Hymenobacter frigidus]